MIASVPLTVAVLMNGPSIFLESLKAGQPCSRGILPPPRANPDVYLDQLAAILEYSLISVWSTGGSGSRKR